MTARLAKDGIDLGIVVRDIDAALGFYRDTLGLEFVAEMPMPGPSPGRMHRLACGASTIKLVDFETTPEAVAARAVRPAAPGTATSRSPCRTSPR